MRISDWSSDVCSSDLLGPSRYSDAHMHRSHILPLAHKFRDVMLGIGFGASLGRAIDTLQPQRLFPQTGGAVQQITDRHSRGRTRTRFDRAPEMLREMIGIEIGRASCRERVCQ